MEKMNSKKVIKDRQVTRRMVEMKSSLNDFAHISELWNEMSNIAQIGTWELDVITNELKWSEVVYDIHEIPRGKELSVDEAINFYIPDHRKVIQEALEKSIAQCIPYDLELKIVTANNKEKWVRAIGKPLLLDGKGMKVQGLFQDIHRHKSIEDDLKKSNKELESFSYSVSHDLRAPLRSINGFAEALHSAKKGQLDETFLKYLDRILVNSKKMETLIDDLLEFSKISRKKVDAVSIDTNSVLAEIVNNYFEGHKQIIKCEPLPDIKGDKDMLEQVFTNILSNAIKYTSKEPNPRIRISGEETAKYVILNFVDNGAGFNMKYVHKLFEVFQRLHSTSDFEGTGVGLAICKKIMNIHEGEIIPYGELGKGSTFTLKFKKH